MKKYFKSLVGEFAIIKDNSYVFVTCFFALLLQILSFIWKPFVFIELLFLIVLIFISKPQKSICFLFFMLPFYNVFRFGDQNLQYNEVFSNLGNIYFSIWLLLAFIISFGIRYLFDLVKKTKNLNIKKIIIYLLLYFCFLFPIKSLNSDTIASLMVVTSLFVSLYLVFEYKEQFSLKLMAFSYLLGIISSVLIFFCRDALPLINDYLVTFTGRVNYLLRDPNYWAFELLVLLVVFSSLFVKGEIKYSFPYIFIILSALALSSNSKAFFFTYIFYIISFVIYGIYKSVKTKKYKKFDLKKTLITGVSTIFLIVLFIICFRTQLSGLFDRLLRFNFVDGSIYDKIDKLTTGRLSIWVGYITHIFSSWKLVLLGRGITNGYEFKAIHNTPLQLIYFCGLIAFILLVAICIYLIIKAVKRGEFNAFDSVKYATVIVMACSLDLLFSYRTYLILILLCLPSNKN